MYTNLLELCEIWYTPLHMITVENNCFGCRCKMVSINDNWLRIELGRVIVKFKWSCVNWVNLTYFFCVRSTWKIKLDGTLGKDQSVVEYWITCICVCSNVKNKVVTLEIRVLTYLLTCSQFWLKWIYVRCKIRICWNGTIFIDIGWN